MVSQSLYGDNVVRQIYMTEHEFSLNNNLLNVESKQMYEWEIGFLSVSIQTDIWCK